MAVVDLPGALPPETLAWSPGPLRDKWGSGITRATERIRKLHPEARVLDGRVLNGSPSGRRLAEWVDGLGI
ncbi:flavodoxin [Parafannyhessea umbonata]|uniref:flavodoxin n=1 Tax=Parafannyhessea umbonata TaxID=604330 RepID=UPI003AB6F3D6